MIPVLYGKDEKTYSTNGIARLNCESCEVTEKINDSFELTMDLPITDKHFKDVQLDMQILASCEMDTRPQPFRIYDIKKKSEGIWQIKAEHVSYWLNHIPVAPPSPEKNSVPHPSTVLQLIPKNSLEPNPFTFTWDKSMESVSVTSKREEAQFDFTEPKTARSLLGDDTKSGILGVFHTGEYKYDRFNVHLYDRRGKDAHIQIRYGKNIKTLAQDQNIENTVTGVYVFYRKEETEHANDGNSSASNDGEDKAKEVIEHSQVITHSAKANPIVRHEAIPPVTVTYGDNYVDYYNGPDGSTTTTTNSDDEDKTVVHYVTSKILHSDNYQKFSYPRTEIIDASSIWDHTPSDTEINDYARAWADAKMLGTPELDLDIDFIALWQKKAYEYIEKLEKLHLGDYVQVVFPQIDAYANGEITEYTWDVLADAYTKFKIGNSTGISDTILNYTKAKYKKEVEYIAQKTANSAASKARTDAIKESIAHSSVVTHNANKKAITDYHKTLQDYYTKTEVDVSQGHINSTIEEKSVYYDGVVKDTNAKIGDIENNLALVNGKFDSYYKKSDIDQTVNNIKLSVEAAEKHIDTVNDKFSNYYTKSQIDVQANSITSTVSTNYSTLANGINKNASNISTISQRADSISLAVQNKADANGNTLIRLINDGSITISASRLNIPANVIMSAVEGQSELHVKNLTIDGYVNSFAKIGRAHV